MMQRREGDYEVDEEAEEAESTREEEISEARE